ncbi:ArnT family glycosyltransferase [Phormidesmis priestleyi]
MQAIQKWLSDKTNQAIVTLLIGGLIFRSIVAFLLPPGFDEAYYYIYTLHPDWSYFDHPPLVAWTTAFGIWLTGDVSQFTIRLGGLLLYTATLYFLYRATVQLFSQKAGWWTLAISSCIPIFQIGFGILTLPDGPLMFFWSLCLWVAACEFFPSDQIYRPTYRLALIGLLVGLACLGKYHGFLLGFGLLAFVLTSSLHRAALKSPWTLLSFGLFLLTISPIFYWNWQHDWVSFRFQSNRGIPAKGYSIPNVIKTALIQSAYLFPTFGLPLWWVSFTGIARSLTDNSKRLLQPLSLLTPHSSLLTPHSSLPTRFLLWISVPAFLSFTLIGGYQQILPTWTMPGFFTATPLLGQQAALWQQRYPKAVKRWLNGSAIVIFTLMLVALSHVSFGTLQTPSNTAFFGGFLKPQEDASIELVDIQQLRREFANSPQLLQALKSTDFMFSNRFHLSGHVAMALTPLAPIPMTCFDKKDMRGFAFWSTAEEWLGKNGLYVTSSQYQIREDSVAEFAPYFQAFKKLGEVPLKRGGVVVETFYVYQGEKLVKPYPRPAGGVKS